MLSVTHARSDVLDGLYVDGKLVNSKHEINIDDVLLCIGRSSILLKRVYLDEGWVRLIGYVLPMNESDLVLLDS